MAVFGVISVSADPRASSSCIEAVKSRVSQLRDNFPQFPARHSIHPTASRMTSHLTNFGGEEFSGP